MPTSAYDLAGGSGCAGSAGLTPRSGQLPGYQVHRGGIYSPDGHCRAFDEHADGTVIGEVAGLGVLKRLSDAVADGDDVRAVILGQQPGTMVRRVGSSGVSSTTHLVVRDRNSRGGGVRIHPPAVMNLDWRPGAL